MRSSDRWLSPLAAGTKTRTPQGHDGAGAEGRLQSQIPARNDQRCHINIFAVTTNGTGGRRHKMGMLTFKSFDEDANDMPEKRRDENVLNCNELTKSNTCRKAHAAMIAINVYLSHTHSCVHNKTLTASFNSTKRQYPKPYTDTSKHHVIASQTNHQNAKHQRNHLPCNSPAEESGSVCSSAGTGSTASSAKPLGVAPPPPAAAAPSAPRSASFRARVRTVAFIDNRRKKKNIMGLSDGQGSPGHYSRTVRVTPKARCEDGPSWCRR